MPFAPDDQRGPEGLDVVDLNRALHEPGWQRWFIAVNEQGDIIGHVGLKGDGLKTAYHRCELGIGIEREYRGKGLGRRLMETAVEFARGVDALTWMRSSGVCAQHGGEGAISVYGVLGSRDACRSVSA